MTFLDTAIHSLAAYPRWFVFICVVLSSGALLWLVAKLLKWTLYVALAVAFAALLGVALLWLLG